MTTAAPTTGSANMTSGDPTPAGRWISSDELTAMGFVAGGPEIDFGMRWGTGGDVRVSWAPHSDGVDGFLYAADRSNGRCLLLAGHTMAGQVQVAWRELIAATDSPDGYLALAALDSRPPALPVGRAREMYSHCLDQELATHRCFLQSGPDDGTRFEAANAMMIARSARLSAEEIALESVQAMSSDRDPVIVRYRLVTDPSSTGRIAGIDLDDAVAQVRAAVEHAARRGVELQATSIASGNAAVAADRVPELSFAIARQPVQIGAPSVEF